MDKTKEAKLKQKRYVEVDETWPRMKGKLKYLQYLSGKPTTFKDMVNAKCYDCMGGFEDGKIDCEIPTCPLYPKRLYQNGEE